MAKKVLVMNQALGFDGEKFELTINKPLGDSVWIDYERKINGHVLHGSSKEDEISEELGVRFKRTIEAFLGSPYEKLVIIGKVIEKCE